MLSAETIKFLILRTIGNFLLLFALFGVVATFGPTLYFEVQYRIAQMRGVQYQVAAVVPQESKLGELAPKEEKEAPEQTTTFGSVITGPKDQVLVPKDTNFGLVIPKIGANTRVLPNVNPTKEELFLPELKKGVAHAQGTVFPGMPGNIYLFAHSTDNFWDVGRYNAIFYLLKDLEKGDDVVVFFENRRHNYVVIEQKIVDASDVSYLTKGQESGQETLILQTCWPPGTTWKRLLIFAQPK